MGRSGFWWWAVVLTALFGGAGVLGVEQNPGDAGSRGRDYISWRDLTVDIDYRFPLNLDYWTEVIVVDPNGRGDTLTVQGAVDMVPENNARRIKIRILPGVYREKILVPKTKPYISFIGNADDPSATVLTWHDKASDPAPGGGTLGTLDTASVAVFSDYFCASGITFENTVVQQEGVVGNQAVALRVSGDKAVFYKVRVLGSQDTLLDDAGSHYFYQSFIQGKVDFIFGNAKSLYQNCNISVAHDGFAVAAHHRNTAEEDTGYSFVNCTITGDGEDVYLGRAWGNYSRIVYSYCKFDIRVSRGWDDWNVASRDSTTDFAEYKCWGKGADRSRRAEWSKALNYTQARPYLNTGFINGEQWLRLYTIF